MLILVVGPSGAGKDTLLNGARDALGLNGARDGLGDDHAMHFVRRVITRPSSDGGSGEWGEEAHESVSEQVFALREQVGDFALSWRAHGLRYGVPAEISLALAQGRIVVANVSRAVVAEAAARFPVAVIEVVAPAELLAARLAARGREDADDVARRLARDIELPLPVTRLVVVNDGTREAGVARMVAAIREAAGLDAVPE